MMMFPLYTVIFVAEIRLTNAGTIQGLNKVSSMRNPVEDVQLSNLCLLPYVHCRTSKIVRGWRGNEPLNPLLDLPVR